MILSQKRADVLRQTAALNSLGERDNAFTQTILSGIDVSVQFYERRSHGEIPAPGGGATKVYKIMVNQVFDGNGNRVEFQEGDIFVVDGKNYHVLEVDDMDDNYYHYWMVIAHTGDFQRSA